MKKKKKNPEKPAVRLMDSLTDIPDSMIMEADLPEKGGKKPESAGSDKEKTGKAVNGKRSAGTKKTGKEKTRIRNTVIISAAAAALIFLGVWFAFRNGTRVTPPTGAGNIDGTEAVTEAGTGNVGTLTEAGVENDGTTAAGLTEAGVTEAGVTEAGVTEAGVTEAGVTEAGVTEAGDTPTEAGGTTEAGVTEAGTADTPATESPVSGGKAEEAIRYLESLVDPDGKKDYVRDYAGAAARDGVLYVYLTSMENLDAYRLYLSAFPEVPIYFDTAEHSLRDLYAQEKLIRKWYGEEGIMSIEVDVFENRLKLVTDRAHFEKWKGQLSGYDVQVVMESEDR